VNQKGRHESDAESLLVLPVFESEARELVASTRVGGGSILVRVDLRLHTREVSSTEVGLASHFTVGPLNGPRVPARSPPDHGRGRMTALDRDSCPGALIQLSLQVR